MVVEDRRRLLALARAALEARVRGLSPVCVDRCEGALVEYGAFVSVHVRRDLRGCLGRLDCDAPIDEVVVRLAAAVADSDPRFAPLMVGELSAVAIEISILTPPRPIVSIDEIELGRHGLIIERGRRRGLLLPQVPVEHGWDLETFLTHTCRKAGLAAGAWRRGARLSVFEADVFGEWTISATRS